MRRIGVELGDDFGDLRVICEIESTGKRRFACRCSCGRQVTVRLDHLRSGHTSSCGQCGLEHNGERKTLKAWAASIGIAESTLRARLKVMSIREAIARK